MRLLQEAYDRYIESLGVEEEFDGEYVDDDGYWCDPNVDIGYVDDDGYWMSLLSSDQQYPDEGEDYELGGEG